MKFTPFHLTVFLAAYLGSDNMYAKSPAANECEKLLLKQGLIHREDSDRLEVTHYGECKLKELLITLASPAQRHNQKDM